MRDVDGVERMTGAHPEYMRWRKVYNYGRRPSHAAMEVFVKMIIVRASQLGVRLLTTYLRVVSRNGRKHGQHLPPCSKLGAFRFNTFVDFLSSLAQNEGT